MNTDLPEWVEAVLFDVAVYLDRNGFHEKSLQLLAVLDGSETIPSSWDEFLERELEIVNKIGEGPRDTVVDAKDLFRPHSKQQKQVTADS